MKREEFMANLKKEFKVMEEKPQEEVTQSLDVCGVERDMDTEFRGSVGFVSKDE